MKPLVLSSLAVSSMLVCMQSNALTALSDEALSNTTGQALFNLASIDPGQSGNPNSNVGFIKLGVQADVEFNANIRKLQLGCGGINGANGCDVDIDYLRFAGINTVDANGRPINDAGPASSFELRNPFLEVAFENPDSLTARRLVGVRLGADAARGMLSIGTRPVDANNNPVSTPVTINGIPQEDASQHTGVNSLTGVIGELVIEGTANINLGLLGDQQGEINGFDDGDVNSSVPFTNVYASRSKYLRVAPLEVNNVVLGIDVTADYLSDYRIAHNLGIANNGDFAGGAYISLSSLGDNIVDYKKNGTAATANRWVTRVAGDPPGDEDSFVDGAGNYIGNKPRDDSAWLKWQTIDNQGNTIWQSAQRGWSLRIPRIEITNFETSTIEADVFESLALAVVNNPDLQQVPIDNCYGTLKFC